MIKTLKKWFGQSSGVANPEPWLYESLSGGQSVSGVSVTPQTVLGLAEVWSSVNLVAGHIATMPLEQRRKKADGGSERVTRTNANRVLNIEPNDLQTPFTFRQTLMAHAILSGNGRAWIERDDLGRPTSLVIMPPEATYTVMLDGEKWHSVYFNPNYIPVEIPFGVVNRGLDGTGKGGLHNIPDKDVLHIPGFGWTGLVGQSLVQVAKTEFGNALSGQQTAGFMFANSGKPHLLLQAPPGVLPTYKEADEFLKWFRAGHEGVSNAAKTGLLRDGITATTLPISAVDAQFIESRRFSREQLSLLLGTEYLLGQSSAVYKDLSERMAAYVTNTLSRWMVTWDEECQRKLLSPQQHLSGNWEFRFDPRPLLRGSPNSLADYTGKLRAQGVISGNEVREIHGFNKLDEEELETFGNPLLGGDESSSDEPAAPEPGDEQETTEQARRPDPIAYNFRSLIQHEQRRVMQAAHKPGEFLERVDNFYGKFKLQLIETCTDLGLDPELAENHCAKSMSQILETAGIVQPAGLADAIGNTVDDWQTRAEEFSQCLT
jgi:HK97 family phage portal protein